MQLILSFLDFRSAVATPAVYKHRRASSRNESSCNEQYLAKINLESDIGDRFLKKGICRAESWNPTKVWGQLLQRDYPDCDVELLAARSTYRDFDELQRFAGFRA